MIHDIKESLTDQESEILIGTPVSYTHLPIAMVQQILPTATTEVVPLLQ